MMTRERAKQVREYLDNGGRVYEGACRAGSFAIAQLHLEECFVGPVKESHGS